jgi:N-acetyl-gamma-glutamyl-phosphate reductase
VRGTRREARAARSNVTNARCHVGVVGASGYSGVVAARLVAGHPDLEIAFLASDRWQGQDAAQRLGPPLSHGLTFVGNGDALGHSGSLDAVLLATPSEVSLTLASAYRARGVKVVDLSGAYRLKDASLYPTCYGFPHPTPALLAEASYGLPELFGAPKGGLVANPGCYPTAALLALAPLLAAGLVEPAGIVIDGKSGVSGAGRQEKEEYSFVETADDLRPYRVLRHQHMPEIAQGLGGLRPTFVPHLVPVRRGLLCTAYARPRAGATARVVAECLKEAYRGRPFVEVVAVEAVRLSAAVGTNQAYVGVTADADVVVAAGALDNLMKGAAGQAVQNLNLLLGLRETAGLDALARATP